MIETKYRTFFGIITLSVSFLCSLGAGVYADEGNDNSVLDELRMADSLMLSKFTLSFEREGPAHDFLPDLGNTRRSCIMSKTEGAWGLECTTIQKDHVTYRPRGTASFRDMDYDEQGNLIVWRLDSVKTFMHKSMNETYYEYEGLIIDPHNRVVDQRNTIMLSVYNVSDPQNSYHLERPLWAAGYGFSSSLESVIEERIDEEGLIRVRAKGWEGGVIPGTWELSIDKKNGPLVRSATFIPDGRDRASVICTTSGTRTHGDRVIATEGRVAFPLGSMHTLESVYRFEDYQSQGDEELLQRIANELTTVKDSDAVEIMDYRADPDRPVRTRKSR